MKQIFKLMLIGLSATFILSGCGSNDSANTTDDNTTTDKLTVKSVELK
jgi:ABC-type glycerol-3-phosphate transport system substrate-binding protein